MPRKPIGPQKAVTAPVMMLQLSNALKWILRVSAPVICAKSSPNNMMSSPLLPLRAMAQPTRNAPVIMLMSYQLVNEKLPADQL